MREVGGPDFGGGARNYVSVDGVFCGGVARAWFFVRVPGGGSTGLDCGGFPWAGLVGVPIIQG